MQAEVVALRHQLIVLQRKDKPARPRSLIDVFGFGSRACGRVGDLP
jgi:hypothetical protein